MVQHIDLSKKSDPPFPEQKYKATYVPDIKSAAGVYGRTLEHVLGAVLLELREGHASPEPISIDFTGVFNGFEMDKVKALLDIYARAYNVPVNIAMRLRDFQTEV